MLVMIFSIFLNWLFMDKIGVYSERLILVYFILMCNFNIIDVCLQPLNNLHFFHFNFHKNSTGLLFGWKGFGELRLPGNILYTIQDNNNERNDRSNGQKRRLDHLIKIRMILPETRLSGLFGLEVPQTIHPIKRLPIVYMSERWSGLGQWFDIR